MFGMLRAASAKLASICAPSMMSALVSPSLVKFFRSIAVLPSFTVALSSTMRPPSLALADSACLSASARTFFGSSIAWLRGVGPNERPPPRKRLTLPEPWRAEPVPFCRYIFFPVRLISLRFLTSCVPRWRLASCQRTQRCKMSALGSRPKIASGTSTEPAALPSSDTTLSSMSRTLARAGRALFGCFGLGCGVCRLRQTELAGLWSFLRQLFLHCVPQRDPTALGARHRALDQDQFAFVHPELGELAFGFDLGNGEMAAGGFGQVLRLAGAGAKLQRYIAVLFLGAVSDNLTIGEPQHRDRHMLAGLGKDAGHSDFLCDYPGTHGLLSYFLRSVPLRA